MNSDNEKNNLNYGILAIIIVAILLLVGLSIFFIVRSINNTKIIVNETQTVFKEGMNSINEGMNMIEDGNKKKPENT
ncbi:MAG: hypothetical protein IKE01_04730 [Clostridia bacterium]|nr:hypothetical protein [Clostridia bacterium]